jgi:3-hydroxyisobutyrate dehydrogenase
MAGHLLAAGHQLRIYTRRREKAEALLAKGARWCASPAEVAAEAEVTFAIVGFPPDVEEVFLGPDGILAGARAGSVVVDMTTSRPDLAQRIAEEAAQRGLEALDAPVSGGDKGAREGILSIMVGGSETGFARVLPFFELMGKTVVHQGPAGSGQHTKMANQIAIASTMMGVVEAVRYAEASGLDPQRVLRNISQGAAGSWTMDILAPRMLAGDFAPGFYVKHFVKDLSIALESAQKLGLRLPGLEQALALYRELTEMGHAEAGTHALYRWYRAND